MLFSSLLFLAAIAQSAAFVPQQPSFGVVSSIGARQSSTSISIATSSSSTSLSQAISKKESLLGARDMIDKIIDETNANPLFVRLAWHDSGTFDKNIKGDWPAAGGAIGSIRFEPEINHGANAGLSGALKLLEPVKLAFPDVSYADIYQMASARGIELAGGPTIDMKYGK
jgi:L-ascorbate peroxidase